MIRSNDGSSILHIASFKGQLDIIQFILNKDKKFYNIDVNYLNNYKMTPLIGASIHGYVEVINLLLDNGANINHQDSNSWSALHYTCHCNRLEAVKVLVERGIDIHLKGNYYKKDETALYLAKYLKNQEIIDYLTPFYNN